MLIKPNPETGGGSAEGGELLMLLRPLVFPTHTSHTFLREQEKQPPPFSGAAAGEETTPNTWGCLWGGTEPVLWYPAGCAGLWAGEQGCAGGCSVPVSHGGQKGTAESWCPAVMLPPKDEALRED